jgi:tetratricopeptide (TPR) repeat protein
MKKYLITAILLVFISYQSFSQKDTVVLSREEAKDLLGQINIDTVKMLRDYSTKACKCIDSIPMSQKDDKEKSAAIAECIDRQTIMYQSLMEINRSMKNGNLNVNVNLDKGSRIYREYYFRIEEWLADSCESLKKGLESHDKISEFSLSTDRLALDQYYKGIDFIKVENYKDALPWFEKAVKSDPNFAFAWDNVGYCSRRLENYDRALEAYQNSLAIDPKGKMPLQNIPIVYQYKKNFDKAIEAYNKLLKVYPEDPEGYFGIGRMYVLKSDLEKGLDNMCKAYNLYVKISSPYRVDAQTIIASIYGEMKKNGQEELFNKILKDNHISTK